MPLAPPNASAQRWPDRFTRQLLTDERALAAAMAYVELNPARAGIANNIETSHHTSVQTRVTALRNAPEKAHEPLWPIVGRCVFRLPKTRHSTSNSLITRNDRSGSTSAAPLQHRSRPPCAAWASILRIGQDR